MPSTIARFCKYFSFSKKSKTVAPKASPHYYDCTPPQSPIYSVAVILQPTAARTTTTPSARTLTPVPSPNERNTYIVASRPFYSPDERTPTVPANTARSYYASENFPEGTSAHDQVRFIRAQDEVGAWNSFPSTRTANFREEFGDCGQGRQVKPRGGFPRGFFFEMGNRKRRRPKVETTLALMR